MKLNNVPIRILEPADGSTTLPLQKYEWPGDAKDDDRDLPRPVTFAWEGCSESGGVEYELEISSSSDLSDSIRKTATTDCWADVLHLAVGTRYYWKVVAKCNDQKIAESPVSQFITHDATPRWIRVPGTTNVRDLGGWPLSGGGRIRQEMVYRSSEMNCHQEITEEGRRVLENELGIRTVIDLRKTSDGEDARPALDQDKVQWINISIASYGHICDDGMREKFRQIFGVFADRSNYPIQFHCWGGADRAGTVAFLLNALLGARMEDLIRDYELTSMSIWGERSASDPERFKNLLSVLHSFGEERDTIHKKVEIYLSDIGVTSEEVDTIRDHLTDSDSG